MEGKKRVRGSKKERERAVTPYTCQQVQVRKLANCHSLNQTGAWKGNTSVVSHLLPSAGAGLSMHASPTFIVTFVTPKLMEWGVIK